MGTPELIERATVSDLVVLSQHRPLFLVPGAGTESILGKPAAGEHHLPTPALYSEGPAGLTISTRLHL